MKVKLTSGIDKVFDDDIHTELLRIEPWGDIDGDEFGQFTLDLNDFYTHDKGE